MDTQERDQRMKISKPLAAAALAATVVGVGAGTAAAADGDRNRDDAVAQDAGFEQVQLENEDGENEGRRGRRSQVLGTAAEFLDVDASEIREDLQDGATLAEVVEAAGFDVDDLVAEIVANVEERLDDKVEAGDITEDEAAEKLEAKSEKIENKINGIETERDNERGDGNADVDADEVTA